MQPAALPLAASVGRTFQWRSLEFILGTVLTGVMLALVLFSVWIFPDRGSAMDGRPAEPALHPVEPRAGNRPAGP